MVVLPPIVFYVTYHGSMGLSARAAERLRWLKALRTLVG